MEVSYEPGFRPLIVAMHLFYKRCVTGTVNTGIVA